MLILGSTLFDGTGRSYLSDAVIRIERGRFAAVGRRADFGSSLDGEEVIDASGRFALPGLINAHAHLTFMYQIGSPTAQMAKSVPELTIHAVTVAAVMLAQGITTARDMGGRDAVPLRIRDAIDAVRIPGPRVIACGEPISVTGGHAWQTCVEADGADEFRKAARRQLKGGADFVKVMASHDPWRMSGDEKTRAEPTLTEMSAAFEVAHEWGRLACCHVMGSRGIGRAIEAGADVIEHGHYLTQQLAEAMARRGVYLTPTLSSYDVQTMHSRFDRGEGWRSDHEALLPAHQCAMLAALAVGVDIIVGTDSVGCYAEEVDLLRRAGMDASQSLQACTSLPAKALRMESEIGSVAVGKRADLVLLQADPIKDPYALEEVELVIKDGRSYRPGDLTYVDKVSAGPSIAELARRPT